MEQAEETKLKEVDNSLSGEPTEQDIPKVIYRPGGARLRWEWADQEITAEIDHVTDKGQAEIQVWYYYKQTGNERLMLSRRRVDFLSTTQTQGLISQLRQCSAISFVSWPWFVTCIGQAIEHMRRPDEPIQEIVSNPELTLVPDYLLKPLLYKGHPNVIFGDKGSLKSLMGLICAYIVQLPYPENKLSLEPGDKASCICLYCDYEDDEGSFTQRWTGIQKGFHVREDLEMPIYYKRMHTRLADAVPALLPEIEDKHIKLLIVDSLGPAARGNLNDPEPAIDYHQALRTLGITSLTIAHRAKNIGAKNGSVFGSVFFSTLARSIWECTAEEDPADGERVICLEHVSANLSAGHERLGYRVTFDMDNNIIAVAMADLRDTGLADKLSLPWRIKNALLRDGPQTTAELVARYPDKKRETVERTIRRLRKDEQVIVIDDGKWAMPA
jgi:hypothetical protein